MHIESANPVRRREDDRFGRWDFACAVADIVDGAPPSGPVVVGVEGPWGSGKSSVLEMAANALGTAGGHRVVRVSAWRTTSQEQFLASLAYAITFALRRDWSAVWLRLLWARLKRQPLPTWLGLLVPAGIAVAVLTVPGLGERIKPFTGTDLTAAFAGAGVVGAPLLGLLITYAARPVMTSFGGLLGRDGLAEKSGAMEQFAFEFDVLAEAQAGRGRFVILIEDLDRATSERVADVLGAVAQLCGHERADRLAFIIAYDRPRVIAAVKASLAKAMDGIADPDAAARGYVDRVIQVGLPLPARRTGIRLPPAAERGWALRFPGPLQAVLISAVAVTLLCHAALRGASVPLALDLVAAGAGFGLIVGFLLTTSMFDGRAKASDAGWRAAEAAVQSLLPENPRDAIRVVNLARAAHALDKGPERLTPTEAMAIAAAEERYPDSFDKDRLRNLVPGGDLPPGTFMSVEVDAALDRLRQAGVDTRCFVDAGRLYRYFTAVRGAQAPLTAADVNGPA